MAAPVSFSISFWCDGHEETPCFVTDFGVGGRTRYDAITEKGRVATPGIDFDTGADRVRSDSSPTLKEIAAMLAEHPELKLLVEGHTDDVGGRRDQPRLSERRVVAAKAALIASSGVDASRLATRAPGATRPAAPNTTPRG